MVTNLARYIRPFSLGWSVRRDAEASTLANAVAAEVGDDVEVVELYTGSLGGPGSGGETYIGMLRSNAELIAGALS